MRRNAQLRILVSSYCLLILDKANDETLDRYGIDIRPHIKLSVSEINDTKGLMHRKQYLEKLATAEAKHED